MMRREDLPQQAGLFSPQVRRASAAQAERTARQTGTERSSARRLTEERYPPANPHHIGSHAGLHTEDRPFTSTELRPRPQERTPVADEEEEVGEYDQPQRARTSSVRLTTPPRQTRNVYPPAMETRRLRQFRFHWLLVAGIVLLVMMVGWMAMSALTTWWQVHQDDVTYGRPRTYQVDAVVGHNADSKDHPSHFVAMNLDRKVIVIELPAGDPSRAIIYTAGTLLGNGQDLTPVTLSFEDRNGDGKPDLNIHIGDQVMVWLNNGQKFVSPQQH